MAKLPRKNLNVFASGASNNGQFGSAQVGTKVTSTDPETLQALAAWAQGWNSAVISGQKLPTLEEMQGLFYVLSYQQAYSFQEGVPEYSAGATYFQNSIVKAPNTTQLFGSLTDNNTGNALPTFGTNNAFWKSLVDLAAAGLAAATNAEAFAGAISTKSIVPSNFGVKLFAVAGYQQLPGGLIIQWGISPSIASGTNVVVTFPMAYPNNNWVTVCNSVNTTGDIAVGQVVAVQIRATSLSSVTLRNLASTTQQYYYITMGT